MSTTEKSQRKRYDEAFKRLAVELLLSSGKPVTQIARELGVSQWNLRDWKERYGPVPVPQSPADLAAENRQLRAELLRVQTQRDILKKTLGILSEPSGKGLRE
jgi:transposase